MAESKIADAVALLGLEIGEEFHINKCDHIYWITPYGDVMRWETGKKLYAVSSFTLRELLDNPARIIKLPWKPKEDDIYYLVTFNERIFAMKWKGDISDLVNYRAGNCFRTNQEAEEAKEKLRQDLQRYYENGGQEDGE